MEKTKILTDIVAEAQAKVHFPTSTMVALRVRDALNDPDCSLDEVARLVKAEPLIATRAVALANSVAFNPSGRETANVRDAIARLGFNAMRVVAAAVATRQLIGTPKDPANRARAIKLWEHTIHVAALAHVIAHRVMKQDAETALFAGIVHEIGGFYLLSRAAEFPGLMEGDMPSWLSEDDGEICGEGQGKYGIEVALGRAVLKALCVPSVVVVGIETMWKGYLTFPPKTLGDTLLLADQLSPVHSPLHEPGAEYLHSTASIDMNINQETLVEMLAESSDHAQSLITALRF